MFPKRLDFLLGTYVWIVYAAVLLAIGWFVPIKILLSWLALGVICYTLLLVLERTGSPDSPVQSGEQESQKEKHGPRASTDSFSMILMGLLPALFLAPFILAAWSLARLTKCFNREKEPIQPPAPTRGNGT